VTSLLSGVRQSADSFAAYAEQTYRGQTGGIHDEVPCALQWAQNSTAVFLGVKYAARWSAPGAIEVVDVTVNSSDCCFHLGGYGHHSSIRKHYLVNLTLFADVDAQMTSWSSGSVGRMTATLHKRRAGRRAPAGPPSAQGGEGRHPSSAAGHGRLAALAGSPGHEARAVEEEAGTV
ncbi:unnamed protein product, partial [Prorocentrum cordatum]